MRYVMENRPHVVIVDYHGLVASWADCKAKPNSDKEKYYVPVDVYCRACGHTQQVTPATHSWPRCPNCDEPMFRQESRGSDPPRS